MEVTASKIKVVEGKGLDGNVAHLSLLLSPPPTPNLETIQKKKAEEQILIWKTPRKMPFFSLLTRLVDYSFYI